LRLVGLCLVGLRLFAILDPRVLHELADQPLDRQRALGELELVAALEHLLLAAGLDRDVLIAEQALGMDRRRGVDRQLEILLHIERHARAQPVVERDVPHLPDRHAGDRHRRARLQAADLVERGVQLEAAAPGIAHATDLDRQISDGGEAERYEQADDQVANR
jgi:hypothetical protein